VATLLDLSSVFGVPANVKEVKLRVAARDSAALGTAGLYFNVGPSSTYSYAVATYPIGSDVLMSNTGVCPCNADGDIYYRVSASGVGTLDAWVEIWGYQL